MRLLNEDVDEDLYADINTFVEEVGNVLIVAPPLSILLWKCLKITIRSIYYISLKVGQSKGSWLAVFS